MVPLNLRELERKSWGTCYRRISFIVAFIAMLVGAVVYSSWYMGVEGVYLFGLGMFVLGVVTGSSSLRVQIEEFFRGFDGDRVSNTRLPDNP